MAKVKRKRISKFFKGAGKFFGSAIGFNREADIVEGSLPIELYPIIKDNAYTSLPKELEDITICAADESDLPLWMRFDHAPNVSRRKIKRRINKNIKRNNKLLKQIKKQELKTERQLSKVKTNVDTADELYNLRKKYLESIIENREIKAELFLKSNDILKFKLLEKIMNTTAGEEMELLPADFAAMREEIRRLKEELNTLKQGANIVSIKKPVKNLNDK